MKIKKVALLAASAVLLAGGITTALAMKYTPGTGSVNGQTDGAIVLNWGTNEDVTNVTSITKDAYVYRLAVVAAPQHSTGISGNAKVTFTLSAADEDSALTGLSVYVYSGTDVTVDNVKAANMEGNKKKATRGKTTEDVVTPTTPLVMDLPLTTATEMKYVLEFDYDGTVVEGKEFAGKLTINLDFPILAA